jgi:hypothetical protein
VQHVTSVRSETPQRSSNGWHDDDANRRQVMMTQNSKVALAGAWFAGAVVLGACAIVAGVSLTTANGEVWLIACLLPPTLILLLRRNQSVPLLQLVNRPSKDIRSFRAAEAHARLVNKAAFRP